ncbi:MAG: methylmalonyl Co-A mutase-associated GTPase MeaB [Halobacteriovoraceae bacterium]|nr:methylmalonyl Co-A mutase-associated GTPase MeaB [Halobacteriovoraceae bacterium]
MKLADYLEGFKAHDKKILAKAITLIESQKEQDRKLASELIEELSKKNNQSRIIGITGTPGVGKSTFLDAYGSYLLKKGKSLCILAIDPSSSQSGGSILGDKTRMQNLVAQKNVFIRPSPSGQYLGGVAAKTKEVIILCESFGFDYIFVETVGVGQSEALVRTMVDFLLMLVLPSAGDDLQAMKRGLLEVADQVVVNKADGDFLTRAQATVNDYQVSVQLLKGKEKFREIFCISSTTQLNFQKIEEVLEDYFKKNELRELRMQQNVYWAHKMFTQYYHDLLLNHSQDKAVQKIETELLKGQISAPKAFKELLSLSKKWLV